MSSPHQDSAASSSASTGKVTARSSSTKARKTQGLSHIVERISLPSGPETLKEGDLVIVEDDQVGLVIEESDTQKLFVRVLKNSKISWIPKNRIKVLDS